MDFDEYQNIAATTDTMADQQILPPLAYYALGLAGESGETVDKIKKIFRNEAGILTDENCQVLALELGDILWYIARISNVVGYSLSAVAMKNIAKLQARRKANTIKGEGDVR